MNPISATVSSISAMLDDVADARAWSLDDSELETALRDLAAVRNRVAELELRLVRQVELSGAADRVGATSAAVWWANRTRQTRPETHRRSRLATALDEQYDVTRAAMARGEVSEEQARVIVAAVEALPEDLEPDLVERAEKELVHHAGEFDPVDLRRLGRKILEVVAPDLAEEHLARRLASEERAAAEDHRLTMSDDGQGRCHGRFTVPAAAGAVLRRALQAIAAPKHRAPEGISAPAVRAPSPQRLGEAFAAYVLGYPTDDLPRAGGVNATVVVTMTMENLTGQSDAPALLDTGDLMSAGQARRWACEAGLVPAVLGKGSVVLDMGRSARFHTPHQRIAIGLRDQTCTAEGCDYPPGMCQVHHEIWWSRGGRTNVDDGCLLCPKHHQMVHDPKYLTERSENGRFIFRRT